MELRHRRCGLYCWMTNIVRLLPVATLDHILADSYGSIGLKRGDSGSIVIDAATSSIYGHVIGINPIGEVYISPYAAIFEQIQNRFPGSIIELPTPLDTLLDPIELSSMSIGDTRDLVSIDHPEASSRKVTETFYKPNNYRLHNSVNGGIGTRFSRRTPLSVKTDQAPRVMVGGTVPFPSDQKDFSVDLVSGPRG